MTLKGTKTIITDSLPFILPTIVFVLFIKYGYGIVIELIILTLTFSLSYQMILPKFPLSATKVLVYTVSIILLSTSIYILNSKIPFCTQILDCKKSISLQESVIDNNITCNPYNKASNDIKTSAKGSYGTK